MQALRILETCLYVDDLDAATRFYGDVLGLEKFAGVAGRHVFFRCQESVFLLFNPAQTEKTSGNVPPHGARGAGHVAFAMAPDEVDRWREHLKTHQIAIESEVAWPRGGISLYFRDPAGNSVELATPQTWGFS